MTRKKDYKITYAHCAASNPMECTNFVSSKKDIDTCKWQDEFDGWIGCKYKE